MAVLGELFVLHRAVADVGWRVDGAMAVFAFGECPAETAWVDEESPIYLI